MSYKPKHFSKEEFACNCGCGGGLDSMSDEFLLKLDKLRAWCGFPIILNSAYRCPDYNDKVSGTGRDGPHTTGKAVDIRVSGEQAHEVLVQATELRFTGIGVSQKGEHSSRFIHLDTLKEGTRPWCWTY